MSRVALVAAAACVLLGAAPALAALPVPSVQVSNDDQSVGVGVSQGGQGAGVAVLKDGSGVCTNGLRYGGPYCVTR
jgi:hypothetical protein